MQMQPPPQQMAGPPPPQPPPSGDKARVFSAKEFPALGDDKEATVVDEETKEDVPAEAPTTVTTAQQPSRNNIAPQQSISIVFNNVHPAAPPISAKSVARTHMPSRDLCYVVHSMLRPLQSLDAYNDDYYHWSVNNRKMNPMMGPPGGSNNPAMGATTVAHPTPVWKEVKTLSAARDEKFLEGLKARAKNFSDEQKSLGQLVKTNVKRPKALLTTPVLTKDDAAAAEEAADGGGTTHKGDSKYELEQRRQRISLWKARVAVDRGYAAFLSLIELRRLIQAHANDNQRVAQELMADVKTNVDKMHASLGVSIAVDDANRGNKRITVDEAKVKSTLSLPKGRGLCARVVEEGILPHPSACQLLPVALGCILSWPLPSVPGSSGPLVGEGEDRLLHALTGLVLTPQPAIDPLVLYRCLNVAVTTANTNQNNVSSMITGSHMRMKLLYSILSVGKNACANEAVCSKEVREGWVTKEKEFMAILASAQKK